MKIFIQHVLKDLEWADRIRKEIKAHTTAIIWTTEELGPGAPWPEAFEREISDTQLVIMLVSAEFLGSERRERELPILQRQRERGHIQWLPILIRPCPWQLVPWLAGLEIIPDGGEPIHHKNADIQNDRFSEVSARILYAISNEKPPPIRRKLSNLRRPDHTLQKGDILTDRFEIIEQLGRGGFGVVWKAFDHLYKQVVALKILHAQYSADNGRRERFFRGASRMAKLSHPAIVGIIERQAQDGELFFYAMEFISGGDLAKVVKRGNLTQFQLLLKILEAGEGLSHAHLAGLIHRDIKPSNILLTGDGKAKLSDFDLVLSMDTTGGTRTGGALGSFIYAAPETMNDASTVGVRADVYGMAMTCLFALYGKNLPIDVVRDPQGIIASMNLSKGLEAALAKGLAWNEDQRFSDVASLCKAIRESEFMQTTESKPNEDAKDASAISPPTLAKKIKIQPRQKKQSPRSPA